MPLLDHFAEDADPQLNWESFHSTWANSIRDALNQLLPPRYFALVQTHLGTAVEADVAEFERQADAVDEEDNGAASSGGVAVQPWAPPRATMVLPAQFPDEFEVQIRERRGARLVGVVELVSPGNKDRPENRRAFAGKCAAYLQRGVGVIVVDIVTERRANLHNELMELLTLDEPYHLGREVALYAVAYRPVRRGGANRIDAWPAPVAVGGPLPLLPLALLGAGMIPLDLEATYTDARQRSRI